MFRDLAVEKMDAVIYSLVLGIEKVTYLWNIKKNRTSRALWALKWEDWGRKREANYCRFFLSMMVRSTGEGRVCGDKWSSWFGECFRQVKVTKWRIALKWSTQCWKGLTQGCKCWEAENRLRSMRTLSYWKWQEAWRPSNCKGHAEKEVPENVKEMQK